MEEQEKLEDFLKGDTFIFLIGEHEEKFLIHSALVSRYSQTFDSMMNSGMKESIERTIKLPEVESEVFAKFAAYAYSGDYSANSRPESDQSESLPVVHRNIDFSKVAEAIKMRSLKFFNCLGCSCRANLEKSTDFPYCSHGCFCEVNSDIDADRNPLCITLDCMSNSKRAYGTLCKYHSKEYGVDNFHMNTPSQKSNISGSFNFTLPTSSISHLQSLRSSEVLTFCASQMLLHAKVVLFAELYAIGELQELAIAKLYTNMAAMKISEAWVNIMVTFLKLVYSNTPDPDPETPFSNRHILRRMIAEFCFQKAAPLMRTRVLKSLICSMPGIAFDLWLVSLS